MSFAPEIILYLEMTITKCQRQVRRMYKNRAGERNNISGEQIRKLREQMVPRTSQRKFADMLQLYGIDLDKNAVQRIESGSRFVTDIELKAIAKVLNTTYETLLK